MGKGLKTLKNQKIFRLGQVFILLAIFSGWVFAQQNIFTAPTPKPKAKVHKTPKATPKVKTPAEMPPADTPEIPEASNPVIWDKEEKGEKGKKERIIYNEDDTPYERFIEVDSNVSIDLCVSGGNLKINGWDRDEVRVFVNRGSKAGFRTYGKNGDGKPTKVTILGHDPLKDKGKDISRCLSGQEIELDIPKGGFLGKLDGLQGRVNVTIESIAKATNVKINSGNIRFREISEGITALTFDGNIYVEDSAGLIDLNTQNGGILVYNVEPFEEGDALKAKTNSGSLVLQSGRHSVVEATSITGLIKFTGEIREDGQYNFKNTSGEILLEIPEDSSCTMEIISQKGKLLYDIPLKVKSQSSGTLLRTLKVQAGDGEGNISIVNQDGRIIIKKIN
jgi:hypothetical protein